MNSYSDSIVPLHTRDKRIVAGYIGKPYNFRNFDSRTDCGSRESSLLSSLGFGHINFLKQIHSPLIVDAQSLLQGDKIEADGIVIQKSQLSMLSGQLFGIRTADCLPIYIETKSLIFLLHGGWRGVASGICHQALALIPSAEQIDILAIGPAASGKKYEVGSEVLDAIENPVFLKSSTDKYLLDLPQTVVHSIRRKKKIDTTTIVPICTMSNSMWHSYRRDQKEFGSNLLFCGIRTESVT